MFNVYTFDHSGTDYLNCEAAQVDVDGSESAQFLTLDEVNACRKDLNIRYKNKGAAFSITSAAMDLKNLIQGLNAKEDVYVLGISYGTSVLQRLVQVKPSYVKGFIFEGVSLNPTKSSKIQLAWVNGNAFALAPTRRLLQACFEDASCPLKFKSREKVVEEMLAILDYLDANAETNLCAKYLTTWGAYVKPSDSLRYLLTMFPLTVGFRGYLPLIYSRLQSCTQEELDMIGPLMDPSYPFNIEQPIEEAVPAGNSSALRRRLQQSDFDEPTYVDPLRTVSKNLYETIIASEIYGPIPALDEATTAYKANPFSRVDAGLAEPSPTYLDPSLSYFLLDVLGAYCPVQGHDEELCQRARQMAQLEPPLTYKVDKYANAPLKLDKKASALILNGGLDFQTPAEFGNELLSLLQGGRGKLSVTFDYGNHCRGEAVEDFMAMPCRTSIIKQFISFNGDVAKIDRSCLKQQPKPSFSATYP